MRIKPNLVVVINVNFDEVHNRFKMDDRKN